MEEHSEDFRAVRDALVALDEADRKRVAALVGAMHDARPPISGPLADFLRGVGGLSPRDRDVLARWCARYLSRWGQIPVLASRRVTAAGGVVGVGGARAIASEPPKP